MSEKRLAGIRAKLEALQKSIKKTRAKDLSILENISGNSFGEIFTTLGQIASMSWVKLIAIFALLGTFIYLARIYGSN